MDILSILGLVIGFGAIIFGQYLEGGHIDTIVNGVAMLIVLGGTLGAVMLQTPFTTFTRALRLSRWILLPPKYSATETLDQLVEWSQIARREGLIRLESIAIDTEDPFQQKGLQLIADGVDANVIREILEAELELQEDIDTASTKVYEAMGGYAPTIGILGAVMGLIHVMGNLADPQSLGSGIAIAFVATIYGVGLANLLFLPVSSKLKSIIEQRSRHQMMMIEGLISIARSDNSQIIESRLSSYLD